jgi:hypothetical protein
LTELAKVSSSDERESNLSSLSTRRYSSDASSLSGTPEYQTPRAASRFLKTRASDLLSDELDRRRREEESNGNEVRGNEREMGGVSGGVSGARSGGRSKSGGGDGGGGGGGGGNNVGGNDGNRVENSGDDGVDQGDQEDQEDEIGSEEDEESYDDEVYTEVSFYSFFPIYSLGF